MSTLYFKVEADYTKLVKLQEEVAKLEGQLRGLDLNITPSVDVTRMQGQLAGLRNELAGLYQNAAMAGQAMRSVAPASGTVRGLTDEIRELEGSTGGVSQGVANWTRQFTAAALAFKAITTAVDGIKASMSTIIDFQAANSRLQAILGTTDEGIKALRDDAMDLGRKTVFTSSQVTQLQIELSKLGFAAEDIHNMSDPLIKFSMAVGANLADAATTAGAALRMFGASTEETSRYVGAMSGAINRSALNFQAVADNLATFGPVAHSIGLEVEDALAIFGKLKDAGYEGSTAATSVRNILNEMSGGKLREAIGGMAIKSIDDFVEALHRLKEAGYDGSEGVAKAMKGVGKRGGAQLLTLIQAADDEANGLLALRDKIVESESGMQGLADTMTNNVAGGLKMLASAWEGFVLQFSASTGPIAKVLETVTNGINALTDKISGKDMDPKWDIAIFGLTELIGLLVTYKAQRLGHIALSKVEAAIGTSRLAQYTVELSALKALKKDKMELIDADLIESVQKGELTQAEALHISQLRIEAEAYKSQLKVKLASVDADIAQLTAKSALATGEEKLLIEKKLNEAQTKRGIIVQKMDAVSNLEDAAAKKVHMGATQRLTVAMRKLWASLLANPFMLVMSAVIGLGMALYSYTNHVRSAELAQKNVNDLLERNTELAQENRNTVNGLITTIQDETKSNLERYEAYKKVMELLSGMEKYKDMTFTDFQNLSLDEKAAIANEAAERRSNEALEKRLKLYESLRLAGYSVSHDRMNREMDAVGITDTEERESLIKELDSISNWTSDVRYFSDAFKELSKRMDEMADTKMTANLLAGMKKVSSQVEVANASFDDMRERVRGLTEEDFKDGTVTESLSKDIEATAERLRELRRERDAVTDSDKKAQLNLEIKTVESQREFMEQLREALSSGKLTWEAFLEIRASIIGEDITHASKDISDSISSAYEKGTDALATFSNGVEDVTKRLGESGVTAESLGDVYSDASRSLKDGMEATGERLDEVREKLRDPKLTGEEKSQLRFDEKELEAAQRTLVYMLGLVDDAVKDPKRLDIIFRFLTSDGKETDLPQALTPNWSFPSYTGGTPPWQSAPEPTAPEPKGFGEFTSHLARYKKVNEETVKEEENANEESAASARNAAISRAEEMRKYAEREKEAKKAHEKELLDLEREYTEASIEAMRDRTERLIEERKNAHKKELDDIERNGKEVLEKFIKQRKDLWDADPNNKKVSAKDKDKKGNGEVTGRASVAFDEEAFKRTEEYAEFEAIVEKNKRKKIEAANRKYLDDLTSDYKTKADERREKEEEVTAAIRVMQEELEKATVNGEESVIALLEERLRLARLIRAESKVNEDYSKYISSYGSFDDKRREIDRKYEADKARLTAEGDSIGLASLDASYTEETRKLNFEELKEGMNWETLFNDLARMSGTYLDSVRDKLRDLINDPNLSIEDRREVAERLNDVNAQMDSRTFLGSLFPSLEEMRRREAEAEQASMRSETAVGQRNTDYAALEASKSSLEAILSGLEGFDADTMSVDNLTFSGKASVMEALGLDETSEEGKKVAKAFDELGEKELRLSKSTKEANKAQAEMRDAQEKTAPTLRNIAADWGAFLGDVAAQVGEVGNLVGVLGLGDTGFGKAVSNVADGIGSAAGAFSDFASGNYVGAVVKGISALKSFGSAIGLGSGNAAEVARITEENTKANQYLTRAVEELTKEMEEARGANSVTSAYKEAIKQQRELIENTREILEAQSGYHAAHHSNTYYLNEELSSQDWAQISQMVGRSVRNADQLLGLTPEQMNKLRTNAALWQRITNTGKYDKTEYWDAYADLAGSLDDLQKTMKESLTGTTFDGMYNDFVSKISDMKRVSKDFSDDFAEMMYNSLLASKIGDAYASELEDFYNKWADSLYNGDLSEDELEEMRVQYEEIVGRATELRDRVAEITGYHGEASDFSSMVSSFTNAVEDMSMTARKAAEGVSEAFYKAMVEQRIKEKYEEQVNAWYAEFDSANRNGTLSKAMIADLKSKYLEIMEAAKEDRDAIAEMTGYAEAYRQSATEGAFGSMSQETGDELSGRFTAIQIAVEAIRQILEASGLASGYAFSVAESIGEMPDVTYSVPEEEPIVDVTVPEEDVLPSVVWSISDALARMGADISGIRSIADDTRNILASSYLELVGIRENTDTLARPIRRLVEDIGEMKESLKRL